MTRAELVASVHMAIRDTLPRAYANDAHCRVATAALDAIAAAGWVVVPREATLDQQRAAFERDGDDGEMYASIYRAMVAASPMEAA